MNVYNRATGWGTFIALILLTATIVVDVLVMGEVPVLRHGLGYALLQVAMAGALIKAIYMIFNRRSPSGKN